MFNAFRRLSFGLRKGGLAHAIKTQLEISNFAFLVETSFLYVGQAGSELLTSGDSLNSASQSAGITGMSKSSCLNFAG